MLIVTPTSGSAPLLVTADASRWADPNGSTIQSYHFDFGDGTVVDAPNGLATHTYIASGTFQLTVTVTDAAGATWTSAQTVAVA
jgi:PKD repeat protein